jgi:hypothetical protein
MEVESPLPDSKTVVTAGATINTANGQTTPSVSISTPELLWHGGGNENGKPDPVYSVDLHASGVLATAGIDENVPPKGSVRVRFTTTTLNNTET